HVHGLLCRADRRRGMLVGLDRPQHDRQLRQLARGQVIATDELSAEEALHRSPRPSAEVFPVKRSRTTGAGVFPVKRSSSRSAIDRRDDEVALWLIALAVRLHAPPLAQ